MSDLRCNISRLAAASGAMRCNRGQRKRAREHAATPEGALVGGGERFISPLDERVDRVMALRDADRIRREHRQPRLPVRAPIREREVVEACGGEFDGQRNAIEPIAIVPASRSSPMAAPSGAGTARKKRRPSA